MTVNCWKSVACVGASVSEELARVRCRRAQPAGRAKAHGRRTGFRALWCGAELGHRERGLFPGSSRHAGASIQEA